VRDLLDPPPDAVREIQPGGEISLWPAGPRVVVATPTGTFSRPHAERTVAFLSSVLAPTAPVHIFADLTRLGHYTREGREVAIKFFQEHAASVETIHFLLASKITALGVSIFKHAVANMTVRTYSSRASFLRSLIAALEVQPEPASP
jgi:hypothetical protein